MRSKVADELHFSVLVKTNHHTLIDMVAPEIGSIVYKIQQ